jgi:DNA-binding XRE family transcriptional regulator
LLFPQVTALVRNDTRITPFRPDHTGRLAAFLIASYRLWFRLGFAYCRLMKQRPRARKGERGRIGVLQNGPALREFRETKRWSTTSFAEELGIAHPTLSNYEAERRSAPEAILDHAAELLDIDVEAIRREKREPIPRRTKNPAAEPAEAVA